MGKKRKHQPQDVEDTAPATKKHQKTAKFHEAPASESTPTPTPFTDEPKGDELRREVDLYERLGSQNTSDRLHAANAVVLGLIGDNGVSEQVLRRHLERRLFRGLASGRRGARPGFSIVITELLAELFGHKQLSATKYKTLTFDMVLDILKAKTKPDGDLSGQEERDHSLGLLFGLQCFVRSKILSADSGDRWEMILENLLQLAKKKPWAREECGWVIIEASDQITQSQAEEMVRKIHDAGLAASPEGVGIWLTARRRFPGMKFPIKPWGENGNPLDHLQTLAKALKESSNPIINGDEEKVELKGSWNPQLHFVWDIVISEYIKMIDANVEGSAAQFDHFWKVAVDESLFSSSASSERKFWGFLLLQKMLKEAVKSPTLLGPVFSQNLMRCLINSSFKEDRFLYRAADKSLKTIQRVTEENQDLAGVVVIKLLTGSGAYNFDQASRTKTIEKLLHQIPRDAASMVISELLSEVKVVKSADAAKDAEYRRRIFGDYLILMIRNVKIVETLEVDQWVTSSALPALASLAYSQDDSFQPAVSQTTRNIFRSRLSSALAHLVSAPDFFLHVRNLLVTFAPSAIDMDKKISLTKDEALAVLGTITLKAQGIEDQWKKPLQALSLIYGLTIFQLYDGEADAVSLLDELGLCFNLMVTGLETDDSPLMSGVLVGALLSFISKPSTLLHKIAQHVVMAFSGEITAEGIEALIEVLESSESLRGLEQLFDHDDEVNEEDKDSDDMLDSDVGIVDASSDEDSEEVETEDDKEEDVEDDRAAQMLDDALAKALGTHRADQDVNEASSDSDADMSDSEMMALDAKLVEIFSQRKKQPNKKQEKVLARENIVNFKTRVLDLLEIYVKEQSTNEVSFKLLLPLLELMRTTSAKHLSGKAYRVITLFAKASRSAKITEDSEVDVSGRIDILKDIHEEASKDPSHAFTKATSTASLLIASTLYRFNQDTVKKIATVYRDTQVKWIKGEWKVQASFFHDWVNWCQSHVL